MRRAKNPGTNIGDGLAAVQRTVELQESFLRYIFGLCRIAESRHHVAMYQAAPLLKRACDFLFERQSILVERKEFGFNAHFCRYAGRGLLPEAMKKHDPLAVESLGVRSVNPLSGPTLWLARQPAQE